MNGSLAVRFLNGFGDNVQPTDALDIVTAGSSIATTLAGSRVPVIGGGSFEVQLANGGTTLRLTDYQPGAVTFSNWAASYGLSGPNAAWNADPNGNGLSNLLEYALGLDPTAAGASRGTTIGTVTENGLEYLSLSYTRPAGAQARPDVVYTPQRATSLRLNNWSSSDIVFHSVMPVAGSRETVTVRSTHPISGTNREFLRLHVSLTP
jgi:hypothetical protein